MKTGLDCHISCAIFLFYASTAPTCIDSEVHGVDTKDSQGDRA